MLEVDESDVGRGDRAPSPTPTCPARPSAARLAEHRRPDPRRRREVLDAPTCATCATSGRRPASGSTALQAEPGVRRRRSATGLRTRTAPAVSRCPTRREPTAPALLERDDKPQVAILREEGTNGDREMAVGVLRRRLRAVGRDDVRPARPAASTSTASAAWSPSAASPTPTCSTRPRAGPASIRFNDELRAQFEAFLDRPDTFSLGVCNGCQLLALLGWVPWRGIADDAAAALHPQRLGPLRVALRDRHASRRARRSCCAAWRARFSASGSRTARAAPTSPTRRSSSACEAEGLAPVRFVDDDGAVTEALPVQPQRLARTASPACARPTAATWR